MRVRKDMFHQPVATVSRRIRQTIKETIALRVFHCVNQVTLSSWQKGFAIGDEKLKVPGVRLVHPRIVDFVDDAVTERKPKPATGVVGGSNPVLCA